MDVQGGPSGIITSQDVPVSGSEVVLTVTRREPGPVTVPLLLTDGCGQWQTLVGFGPGVEGIPHPRLLPEGAGAA